MKKKLLSLALAVALCLGLLPVTAFATESRLPDWYFLFAIFKNVDADCKDKDGNVTHITYSMTKDEINFAKEDAQDFETYMNQTGVMRAHVDVVEIDAAVTELKDRSGGEGSLLGAEQATPLLESKVDLDRYDHVTCFVSLNANMSYLGITSSEFENGNGHACINLKSRDYCMNVLRSKEREFSASMYVHEFLHFMERMNQKWGAEFGLHDIRLNFYIANGQTDHGGRDCYTDIILNQAKGDAGTGVHPAAWQYPPHVLRTATEWTIPNGVNSIGKFAFASNNTLTRVFIPSSVTSIGRAAFQNCRNLTSMSLPASIARVEDYTFANCGLTDVYYSGNEAQWKAIPIGVSNSSLQNATIHYNSLLADVKTTDYFAQSVEWALENGITTGSGNSRFSPDTPCTQGQILTFLWRAKGSPQTTKTVTDSEYYAVPIQWAKEQGITDTDLSPNAPCTRADAVTYLWKLAGSPATSGNNFTDVPTGANYAQAVTWAVKESITSGTNANTFSPDTICTRGQIVTFLYRNMA